MQLSYWEKQIFENQNNTIIIGGGIVGLSTAIALKENNYNSPVIIVDQAWPPRGASSKNAGFVCYGSVSEILADLKSLDSKTTIDLIKMRWQGAKILTNRIEDLFNKTGGYELYKKGERPSNHDIQLCNDLFEEATTIKDYFKLQKQTIFPAFDDFHVQLKEEGMIDPFLAINLLKKKASLLGVQFLIGHKIIEIDKQNKLLTSSDEIDISYEKCIICTNGFARTLLPNIDVTAVRNQVLVTNKIKGLAWRGVYHHDEGYIYFRNIGDRVLIGGARNIALVEETTSSFGINKKIRQHLEQFLKENVLPNMNYTIDYNWSGILGVSNDKYPIVKSLGEGIFIGVKLGGMGVAIGSLIGEQLSNLIIKTGYNA